MSTNDYSGAENVNFSIIEGLKDKYDFYWVSRKGNINRYLEERKIKWIEIEKLSIKEIKRVIKQFKPEILHATDYKASVICSFVKKDTYLIEHLHNNSPWLKKININSIIFLIAGLRANRILTVSNSIEKEYIFSRFLKNKINNVGNPVSRKKILDKVNEKDYIKKYDICCVARLTKQKNPEKFIEIINELKKTYSDIKVIWVGDGELKKATIEKCKNLNLEENVKFAGFQKNPYIYMSQSKMFLLTSDWEGYGLVAFEALTLGLPCVVSNVGGLLDIVDDKCGRLCNINEDFIEELQSLLENEDYYTIKKNNAIEKSKKLDNFDIYISKIQKIYD